MNKKRCSRCGEEKLLTAFNRRARAPDGRNAWCRDCAAKWREEKIDDERRERYRQNLQLARQSARSRMTIAICNARKRAATCGVPFNLIRVDLPDFPADCPCCGKEFIYNSKSRLQRPSLDRIYPSSGYVPGNVQWLCLRCNQLKNNATSEELMRVALFMSRNGE